MCSGRGDEQLCSTGFPIRKSPDRSLVADSPGLIAGSYVLLRLLVPRHSPCALINLATTDDARVHCAVLKIRAVPAPAAHVATKEPVLAEVWPHKLMAAVPSGPNSVLGPLAPGPAFRAAEAAVLAGPAMTLGPNNQCSTNELATSEHSPEMWLWTRLRDMSRDRKSTRLNSSHVKI